MGAAFSTVVDSFTKLVMDTIGQVIGGNPNFDDVSIAGIAVGPFITALVTFLLTATVVYFGIVLPVNRVRARFEKPADPDEPGVTSEDLLAEIRDILKEK